MRTLIVLSGVVAVLIGCTTVRTPRGVSADRAMSVGTCVAGTWSAPTRLANSAGRPIYIESPSAVPFGGGAALFGTPTFLWRSATVFADTAGMRDLVRSGQYVDIDTLVGAIVHPDGTATTVGRPRGVSSMSTPLAVSGPNGSVDVLWMTRKDTTKQFTDLWFARYSTSGWSEPEHVLRGHYFEWSINSASAVAGDGYPIVAITGTEKDSAPTTGIGIVHRVGADWRVTWIPTGLLWPFRVKLGASDSSHLIVAFLGSVLPLASPRDTNGLFIARSSDRGATWEPLRRIERLWNTRAVNLQMVMGGRDTTHLLWREGDSPSASTRIRRTTSIDGGRDWRKAGDAALDRPIDTFDVAELGGHLQAVVRETDTYSLAFLKFRNDGNVEFNRLPQHNSRLIPRLAALAPDRLLLTEPRMQEHAYPMFPGVAVPVTLYATMSARCQP